VPLEFTRLFTNSVGVEVAGVWFDDERSEWRVSTEPIRRFATQQDAVDFFNRYCDQETGLPGKVAQHGNELIHRLVNEVNRGDALRRESEALAGEVQRAIAEQREAVRLLRYRLARSASRPS